MNLQFLTNETEAFKLSDVNGMNLSALFSLNDDSVLAEASLARLSQERN